jgi:hypothetical protein
MTERDTGNGTQPIPETSETTSEERALEDRRRIALQKLFLTLEADAERKGKPVNAEIRAVPMIITNGVSSKAYVLRINPALMSDGKLSIAVLDLYHEATSHLQQWVVKAEWQGGMPEITGLDESVIEESDKQFRLTEIAEYAEKTLSGNLGETDTVRPSQSLTMQMPPSYSRRIN